MLCKLMHVWGNPRTYPPVQTRREMLMGTRSTLYLGATKRLPSILHVGRAGDLAPAGRRTCAPCHRDMMGDAIAADVAENLGVGEEQGETKSTSTSTSASACTGPRRPRGRPIGLTAGGPLPHLAECRHYINLTNGIEAIPTLDQLGLSHR